MIKLEFRNLIFVEGEKPENPEKKTLEARERINNKFNSHTCMIQSPGIEHRSQW
jgi:hypothetical protein